MSHTKGRLHLSGISQNDGSISLALERMPVVLAYVTNAASFGDMVAAMMNGRSAETPGEDWAHFINARRIVALWNAAEELGLTTEAIEAGAIQNLAKGCGVGLSRAQELRDATDDAVADTGIWGLGNEALADDIDIMDCALAQCRSLAKAQP